MLAPRFIRTLLLLLLPGSAAGQAPPASAGQSGSAEPAEAEPAHAPTPAPSLEQQASGLEQTEPEPPGAVEFAPAPQASEPGSAPAPLQTSEHAGPPADRASSAPLATPTFASAKAPEGVVDEPPYSGPLGSHQRHFFAWIGVRNDYVRDQRFDMFASNDSLTAFSLGVGVVAHSVGELSLAGVLFWETAGKEADARGDSTDLRVHRFELGPELRYHLHYRFYGFARFGLGVQYSKAVIESQLAGSEFAAKDWIFSSELTGGAALQFFGKASGEGRSPRGWFVAEGGYALSSGASLNFQQTDEGPAAPERAQMDDFGTLAFRAPLFRLALAGSY